MGTAYVSSYDLAPLLIVGFPGVYPAAMIPDATFIGSDAYEGTPVLGTIACRTTGTTPEPGKQPQAQNSCY